MKRALGAMAMNWLRKPENQERVKRTARDVWGRFQAHRNARATTDAGRTDRAPAASRPPRDTASDRRDDGQP